MLVGKEASTENVLIKVKAKEEEIVGGLIVQLKLEKIINLFFCLDIAILNLFHDWFWKH